MSITTWIVQAAAQLPPPADDLPAVEPEKVRASEAIKHVEAGGLTSQFELNLTVIILFFAVLALVLLYLMIRSEKSGPFE
ncbi:MAG: hypothetical protein ACJ8EZ_08820, partial [Sphingomicrobium sp.]